MKFLEKIDLFSAIGLVIAVISFILRWIIERSWYLDMLIIAIIFMIIFYSCENHPSNQKKEAK